MIFDRQTKIWNPEKQRLKIIIVGVGSVGSFVGLTLAKMGFENITAIDFDKVDDVNIPNQFYRTKDIGSFKVNALKDIIENFTETEIETFNGKWEKFNYDETITQNTLVIMAVDKMDVRKEIYENLKDYPIMLTDCRMGGQGWEIYNINLNKDDDKTYFESRLDVDVSEEACGQKAIIYNVLNLSSEICNAIRSIDMSQQYPKIIKRDMKGYKILSSKKEIEIQEPEPDDNVLTMADINEAYRITHPQTEEAGVIARFNETGERIMGVAQQDANAGETVDVALPDYIERQAERVSREIAENVDENIRQALDRGNRISSITTTDAEYIPHRDDIQVSGAGV